MRTTILSLVMATMAFNLVSAQESNVKSLIINQVLKEANSNQTYLGKSIEYFNSQSAISFKTPVTAEKIQIATIKKEVYKSPWTYAYKSHDQKSCIAEKTNTTYLVLIESNGKNRSIESTEAIPFKIELKEVIKAYKIDNSTFTSCTEILNEKNANKYIFTKSELEFTNVSSIALRDEAAID